MALLVVLTISTGMAFCQPVTAADTSVNSGMSNDAIQIIINNAGIGDTITFVSGVYNNLALTITNALNLVSDNAIINSNYTVFTVSGSAASGTNITGFSFNGNGTNTTINVLNTGNISIANNIFNNTWRAVSFSNVNDSSILSNNITNNSEYGIYVVDSGDLTHMNNVLIDGNRLVNSSGGIEIDGSGFTVINNYVDNNNNLNYNAIDGSSLYSALIRNNTLLNGADGVNIFGTGINLTIDGNFISHMKGSFGDGISVITHTQIGSSSITNNVINDTNYGIWQGGFIGNISGNIINNSAITAINMTSKMGSGSLSANITNNTIINSPNIGIAIEVPTNYLNLSNNNIDSDRFNIEYGSGYRNNGTVIIGDDNILSNGQNFKISTSMTNDYIQSIIDGANAGDTITFLAGTYKNLTLTINNALNLVGTDAIVNSSFTVFSINGTNASGTNVTGFTFNGNGTNTAVSALNTLGINIANNTFNNTKRAVSFTNVNGSSVVSNNFTNDADYGVYVSDSGDLNHLNNVLISGNKLINTTNGFSIDGSGFVITNNYIDMYNSTQVGISGSTVYSTLIQNNIISNGGDGINLAGTVLNMTIDGNTVTNMTRRFGDGISIMNHNNALVYSSITNNVVDNVFYGFFIGGYFNGNISGNSINNVGTAGINFTQKMGPGNLNANVTNNNITNDGNIGIAFESTVSYLNMVNNTISSDRYNLEYATTYVKNGTLIMDGNTLSNGFQNFKITSTMTNDYIQGIINGANAGDTITFLKGTYNNISLTINKALNLIGNSVAGNAILNGNGTSSIITITGTSASGTNITGFTIDGTGNNTGIKLNSTSNVNVKNNNITNNAVGVEISNGQGNSITSNNITNNTGNGVNIKNSHNNKVSKNNISDNGGDGISIDPSTGNQIANNTIANNKGNGLSLNNSNNNTITGNNIVNNKKPIQLTNSENNVFTGNTPSEVNIDNIPPTVTKVDPAKNTVIKATNKVIKVTFSEPIKAGSKVWVDLKNSSGTLLDVITSINGNVLTITPKNLLGNGKYSLGLHTGAVTDLAGNPMALYSTSFSVDAVAPKVSKVDPANNAVNVWVGKTIKVTFSETIKAGSKVWIELKNSAGKAVSFNYKISGNTLTVDPNSNLAESKYKLTLHSGAVTDLSGNFVAAFSSYFSVGTSPKVSKIDPVNGATLVSAGKTIKITFNEAIKAGSKVWVELKNSSNKAVAFKYTISGKILTIDPTKNLAESKYTLVLHSGAVTDLAGNALAAKSSTFTVGTAPKVSKIDPKNGATKVSRSKLIKVTFNEAIKSGSNYWIELKTSSGKLVKINSRSISGKTLSINHAKLAANTKYRLVLHTGSVTDKAGNPIAAKTYNFTTGKT